MRRRGGFCIRKYENFCNSLFNMKDIYKYEEPYDNGNRFTENHSYNRKIALGIIADAKEEFYQMFCELKTEIEENWL